MRVDGRLLADRLLDDLSGRVAESSGVPACLATLVADDEALSHRQAALKHRACERVGMRWAEAALQAAASTEQIRTTLDELAGRADGIFVHLPLPPHVDVDEVVAALPPDKDVDGLHPDGPFVAASASGTLDVLRAHGVSPAQSSVVVIGEPSPLVRGLRRMLEEDAADWTLLAPTDGAAVAARSADVVVAAAYRPGLVSGEWVRAGAAVVDAASGDVDVGSVGRRAGLLCASPGGIGPLTVARLLVATHAAAAGRVGTPDVSAWPTVARSGGTNWILDPRNAPR